VEAVFNTSRHSRQQFFAAYPRLWPFTRKKMSAPGRVHARPRPSGRLLGHQISDGNSHWSMIFAGFMSIPLRLEGSDAADGDAEASLTQPALGEGLRRLRRGRGLSLAEVAAGTDVSASFLALVERGQSDIAIGRLMRILHFYEASVTELVPNWQRDRDEIVVRRGDARKIRSADGVDLYLLAPDTNRAMMPVLTTFEPHPRLT